MAEVGKKESKLEMPPKKMETFIILIKALDKAKAERGTIYQSKESLRIDYRLDGIIGECRMLDQSLTNAIMLLYGDSSLTGKVTDENIEKAKALIEAAGVSGYKEKIEEIKKAEAVRTNIAHLVPVEEEIPEVASLDEQRAKGPAKPLTLAESGEKVLPIVGKEPDVIRAAEELDLDEINHLIDELVNVDKIRDGLNDDPVQKRAFLNMLEERLMAPYTPPDLVA